MPTAVTQAEFDLVMDYADHVESDDRQAELGLSDGSCHRIVRVLNRASESRRNLLIEMMQHVVCYEKRKSPANEESYRPAIA